jgi:hypothetical protein
MAQIYYRYRACGQVRLNRWTEQQRHHELNKLRRSTPPAQHYSTMALPQRPRMQSSGISTLNLNKPARPGIERAPTSTNLTRPLPIHRLDGKVALITGGGGKVGVETAGRLLIEGANVALIDINQQSLEVAVPVLKAAIPTGVPLESRLLTIAADATNEADVEACVKKTVQRFGRLDCALLNAGERDSSKSLFDTTAEDFESIMTTNAKSGKPTSFLW